MKEGLQRTENSLRRKAARMVLTASLMGGLGAAGNAPLSVSSCEQFLTTYTPVVDGNVTEAADALSYHRTFFYDVYPSPSQTRSRLASVIPVIQKDAVASIQLWELEDVYKRLPPQESLQAMEKEHITNDTFASQKQEIENAQQQLRRTLADCERIVPPSLRKDSWYVQEQQEDFFKSLWNSYKLEILLILGFLGVGILEKLFIGDKNS